MRRSWSASLLVVCVVLAHSSSAWAQLHVLNSVTDAESLSKQTGRPILAIAGSKT